MSQHPVVHFEMPYDDAARVAKFYSDAFGWGMNALGPEMGSYVVAHTADTDERNMVTTPGTINGGFARRSEAYRQPSVVISVGDIETAMKRIAEAGGHVLGAPVEIPGIGLYVSFRDTEGNTVSILQPLAM